MMCTPYLSLVCYRIFEQDVGIALEAMARLNAVLIEVIVSPEEISTASHAAVQDAVADRDKAAATDT